MAIDDYDFVVCDGVPGVDTNGNARVGNESRGCEPRTPLAFVHNHLHVDATFVRVYECFRDWYRGEGVGEDSDGSLGGVDYLYDEGGTSAVGENATSSSPALGNLTGFSAVRLAFAFSTRRSAALVLAKASFGAIKVRVPSRATA
jgi:hypothetical protein